MVLRQELLLKTGQTITLVVIPKIKYPCITLLKIVVCLFSKYLRELVLKVKTECIANHENHALQNIQVPLDGFLFLALEGRIFASMNSKLVQNQGLFLMKVVH